MRTPIQAQIDIAAAVHNCEILRQAAGTRKLFAVIKADAYGHGMVTLATGIAAAVDGLCVYQLQDAIRLREEKIELPLLVLGGFRTTEELAELAAAKLWAVVHEPRQIDLLEAAPHKLPRVFVKAQTGMHRLGLPIADVPIAVERLRHCGCELSLMHHFANADVPQGMAEQQAAMQELVTQTGLPYTASNSAATLLADDPSEEFVRCGISVYGCTPAAGTAHSAAHLELRPVMSLMSEVISLQQVAKGCGVGYGSRWRAPQDMQVAVVACGYADGYPRLAPDGTPVVIAGQRLELVGRVSMEMLTVAVTGTPIELGAPVELWGAQVSVDEVADAAGTIAYELLAGMPAKVERRVAG